MYKKSIKNTVHKVLTESYMIYMLAILVGVLTHSFFKIEWMHKGFDYLGIFFMVAGPYLISLAQKASAKFKKIHHAREVGPKDFMYGPYAYIQSPTHMGIFLLVVGFSLVVNSFSLVACSLIAYILTHTVFLPKEQKILKKKYGAAYEAYLKKVKFSL